MQRYQVLTLMLVGLLNPSLALPQQQIQPSINPFINGSNGSEPVNFTPSSTTSLNSKSTSTAITKSDAADRIAPTNLGGVLNNNLDAVTPSTLDLNATPTANPFANNVANLGNGINATPSTFDNFVPASATDINVGSGAGFPSASANPSNFMFPNSLANNNGQSFNFPPNDAGGAANAANFAQSSAWYPPTSTYPISSTAYYPPNTSSYFNSNAYPKPSNVYNDVTYSYNSKYPSNTYLSVPTNYLNSNRYGDQDRYNGGGRYGNNNGDRYDGDRYGNKDKYGGNNYSDRYTDKYNDKYSDKYNDKYSDKYNDKYSDKYNKYSDKYNDRYYKDNDYDDYYLNSNKKYNYHYDGDDC